MMGVRGMNGRKPAGGLLGDGRSADEVAVGDGRGGWERRSATERWSGRSGMLLDARRSRRDGRCWGSTFMAADMMRDTSGLAAFEISLAIRDAYLSCRRRRRARAWARRGRRRWREEGKDGNGGSLRRTAWRREGMQSARPREPLSPTCLRPVRIHAPRRGWLLSPASTAAGVRSRRVCESGVGGRRRCLSERGRRLGQRAHQA